MVKIAVITPCAPAHIPFLEQAYESLTSQQGVEWEWAIQIDGPADVPIIKDDRVSIQVNERSWGAAVSRNRALTRTTSPFVISFDADDVLCEGSLACMAGDLEDNPECAFVNATILNWHPDGSLAPNPRQSPLPEGVNPPGAIEAVWRELSWHGLNTGVTMYRRNHLLAMGGWSALSGAEDNDLMMACNAGWPCYIEKQPAIHYRMHEAQTTRSKGFFEMRMTHRNFSHQRLNALRELRGEAVPEGYQHAPQPPEHHAGRSE